MKVVEHNPPVQPKIGRFEHGLFLAGPIEGADDWQSRTIEIIRSTGSHTLNLIHIFNPRRQTEMRDTRLDPENYKIQTFWEQDQLALAADIGAHLFWLEARNPKLPYTSGREYARTTIKELCMSIGGIFYGDGIKMAVGIDPDFDDPSHNLRYCRETLKRLHIPIRSTLEDTCSEALALLSD
jgi:hypothetical protein